MSTATALIGTNGSPYIVFDWGLPKSTKFLHAAAGLQEMYTNLSIFWLFLNWMIAFWSAKKSPYSSVLWTTLVTYDNVIVCPKTIVLYSFKFNWQLCHLCLNLTFQKNGPKYSLLEWNFLAFYKMFCRRLEGVYQIKILAFNHINSKMIVYQ